MKVVLENSFADDDLNFVSVDEGKVGLMDASERTWGKKKKRNY